MESYHQHGWDWSIYPAEETGFVQSKEKVLWDLIAFQYLWGDYGESGRSLVTVVHDRAIRSNETQTETEEVLSKYKENTHYEDN